MYQNTDSKATIYSKEPLLSIIVPVYNVEKYLGRCIDSIIAQTYSRLEIILIDDGSVDESWNICLAYSKKDSRIVIAQQPNSGSSIARNTGLSLASGDFIGFVDSDDYIKSQMFQTLISFALQNDLKVVECGLTSTNSNPINQSGLNSSFVETKEEAFERLLRNKNWSVWRRIYRKEVLSDLKFIPGKIHQDVFFTVDVLNRVEKQGYVAEQFYIYNTENESITRSPYSMKKLDAKDAPYYVFDNTRVFNLTVRTLASKYLIRTLLSHYDRLFSNSHLDKKYIYRKEIKNEITDQLNLNYDNNSLFATLAKFSPFWLYDGILKLNAFRIKIKLMLLKL